MAELFVNDSEQKGHSKMKRLAGLLLVAAIMILTLAACGSKDALAGTWSAELGADGVITWSFNGKGKCTMENAYMKQKGTYSIEDDQLTVTLETWSEPSTYTFSVDGRTVLPWRKIPATASAEPLQKNDHIEAQHASFHLPDQKLNICTEVGMIP